MTPPSNLTHVVSAEPGDDHAVQHGQSIGSFRSDMEAWTQLNQVQFAQCRHATPTHTRVSVDDEPGSELASDAPDSPLPVPAADLAAAATRLRPDLALQKALTRLLDGGWTYQDDDELVIRFDPRSKGRGKQAPGSYTTKRDSCTCPGAIIRGGCYHPVAWQIVNEARMPTRGFLLNPPKRCIRQ